MILSSCAYVIGIVGQSTTTEKLSATVINVKTI